VSELVGAADHVDAHDDPVRDIEDERGVDAAVGTLCDQAEAAVEVASTSPAGEPRRITTTVMMGGLLAAAVRA
jgi:hypothetical protein